jgi:hypothetical protein
MSSYGNLLSIDAKIMPSWSDQRIARDPSLERHLTYTLASAFADPGKATALIRCRLRNQIKRGERAGGEKISSVDILHVRMDEPRMEFVHGLLIIMIETRRTLECHVSRVHRWEIPGI